MIIRNRKHHGLKAAAALLMASTCLAPFSASAHTDSLGFLITPGASDGLYNAEIFYGSWHSGGVGAEGQLTLTVDGGAAVDTKAFAIVSGYGNVTNGVLPAGLTPGVNYFFPDLTTVGVVDLAAAPVGAGHSGIYAFQSVVFTDLAAGSYTFGYSAGSSLSQNWLPSDAAINAGRFTIGAGGGLVVDGAGPSIPDIDAAYTLEQLAHGDVNPVFDGGALVASADTSVSSNLTVKGTGGAIDTAGHDVTVSGVISDAASASGALTKTGDGVLILTGANTYSGGTTVEAGVLRGDATSLQGDIVNDATVEFAQEGQGAYNGVISGLGDLVKSGQGTLTLTSAQTYTGQTVIDDGVLALSGDGSIASSSGLTVNGALDVSGLDADAAVKTLGGAGQIVLGDNTLIVTNADGAFAGQIQGAGGLEVEAGSQTLSGVNAYAGATVIGSGATLALSGAGSIAASSGLTADGTFDISAADGDAAIKTLDGSGKVKLGANDLVLTAADGDFAGQIQGAGGLRLQSGAQTLSGVGAYAGATVIGSGATLALSGAGSIAASSGLTADGTFDISAAEGDAAIKTLDGSGKVKLGANDLVLTAADGDFAGQIQGAGGLRLQSGAQTLSGVDAYAGATVIGSGATLALSGAGSIAASSGLTADGTFDISAADGDAAIKTLDGSGKVTLGANDLVLTAADGDFAGQIQGAGGLRLQSGAQTLSGFNAYSGETVIASGAELTVQGGSALADSGHVALGGRLNVAASETIGGLSGTGVLDLQSNVLTLAGPGDDAFGGAISGEGRLVKTGAGVLRLSGENTFTGGLTVNAGVLEISSDDNLGAGPLTLGAARLKSLADFQSDNAFVVTSQNSVIDTSGKSVLLSGDISGAGALVKEGAGTLTLTGQNSQNGIRVVGGTLQFNSDAALGAAGGVLSIADNTTLRTLDSFTITHELHVENTLLAEFDTDGHDIVMAGDITGAGSVKKTGDGTLTLTGENTQVVIDVLGGKVIAASQAAVGDVGGTIYLRDNAGFTAGTNMTITQTVQVTGENATFDTGANSVVLAGELSGDACFNKVGTGSLSLTNAGSNAVGACVQQGTLKFNNVFTGQVWVEADGVAGGSGAINGDVEVRGKLSPGNSPGQLTVNGSVTQLDGSVFAVEIDGPTAGVGAGHHDTLVLTGAGGVYTADGAITPVLRGISGSATNTFTPQIGDTFQVVTAEGGVIGSYDTLVQPTDGLAANTRLDVRYRANAVILAVTPTSFAQFGGAGNAGAFGGAVDALRPAAGVRDETAAGRLVDGLIGLDAAQLSRVLRQGAGEIYADAASAVLQTGRTARGVVAERLAEGFADADAETARHAWGTITHDEGKAKADAYAERYSADATSIVLGYDAPVGAKLILGGAFAYNATQVRTDLAAKADVDSYMGMAYGAWRSGRLYVNGLVGFGADQYKVERSVGLSTGAEALWSKPDGRSWAADLEIGRSYQAGGLTMTPAVGVGYDSVSLDSFAETGADTLALRFAHQDRTAWTARAGARFSTTWSSGERSFSPYASVFVTRELGDREATFNPSLQGQGFEIRSPSVDRTGVRLGAGVTAQASARVQLQLGYRYDDADGASRQSVTGGAIVRW